MIKAINFNKYYGGLKSSCDRRSYALMSKFPCIKPQAIVWNEEIPTEDLLLHPIINLECLVYIFVIYGDNNCLNIYKYL